MGQGMTPLPTQGLQLLRAGSPLGLASSAQELGESGGEGLKIFISSFATVLSLTQRIHSFRAEAVMIWKLSVIGKKVKYSQHFL